MDIEQKKGFAILAKPFFCASIFKKALKILERFWEDNCRYAT